MLNLPNILLFRNTITTENGETTLRNEEGTADKFRFLFSGLTAQEKIEYGAVVEELGGTVYDVQYFNTQCTHVIVNIPSRFVF